MKIEITTDQLTNALNDYINTLVERALSVAPQVPQIIKDTAVLENIDKDGNQMNAKKPRPTNHPTNNPGLPCIDSGNLMDNTRWTTARASDTTVNVIYDPPDYFEHLISKDPQHGGRPWISHDKINADARATIEEAMILAMGGEGARGFERQDVPEGFSVSTKGAKFK